MADEIWMLENSIYSILSPEGMASILYKDSSKASEVSEKMKITSQDLYKLDIIDRVIKEPEGGAQKDITKVVNALALNLEEALGRFSMEPIEFLLSKRYSKFRRMGRYRD